MADMRRRLIGFGLPFLLLWALDLALTLHGQPPEYWAGDYGQTTEGGAFYRRLYILHPLAGVGGHLLWCVIVVGLLVLLPEVLAVVLTLAAAFGHTWGAATWVSRALVTRAAWGSPSVVNWYQATNGLFLAAAVVTGVGIFWTIRTPMRYQPGKSSRAGTWWRGTLAVGLMAAAGAIAFLPW
jgi:hypothetical protein